MCLVALQRNAKTTSQDSGWTEKLERYLEKINQEGQKMEQKLLIPLKKTFFKNKNVRK